MHTLWNTQNWKEASESEVIAALFSPPPFIDPADMSDIKKYHPGAKGKYLNLYYEGTIPKPIKRIHKI